MSVYYTSAKGLYRYSTVYSELYSMLNETYLSLFSLQVYATDGDDNLGGSDMDICLYDYLKQQVRFQMNI